MLKSIKSNYLPARPYNRHTSVVDLSTDFSAGNILKRNNKMSKSLKNIDKIINDFINNFNKHEIDYLKKHGDLYSDIGSTDDTRESLGILIVYGDDGFTIDGDFYSQVKEYQEDGSGINNYLYKLWVQIEECVDSFGYYLEEYGFGEYKLEAK